jgi:hypothetical protein
MIPLYAPAIQQAIEQGNLAKMKQLLLYAEQHVAEWGDLTSALEVLQRQISQLKEDAHFRDIPTISAELEDIGPVVSITTGP